MALPTFLQWAGETGPVSCRGKVCGLLGSFGFLGNFLAPLIFAPIILIMNPDKVFLISRIVAGIILISLLSVEKERISKQSFS